MNREQAEKLVWFAISIEKLGERGWPSKLWAVTCGSSSPNLKDMYFHDDLLKQDSCAGYWLPYAFPRFFKWLITLSGDGKINMPFSTAPKAWGDLFGIDEESFFYLFPQLRDEDHPKHISTLHPYMGEMILKETPVEFKERVMLFIKGQHNHDTPLSR